MAAMAARGVGMKGRMFAAAIIVIDKAIIALAANQGQA
jgi:hypothetical protein